MFVDKNVCLFERPQPRTEFNWKFVFNLMRNSFQKRMKQKWLMMEFWLIDAGLIASRDLVLCHHARHFKPCNCYSLKLAKLREMKVSASGLQQSSSLCFDKFECLVFNSMLSIRLRRYTKNFFMLDVNSNCFYVYRLKTFRWTARKAISIEFMQTKAIGEGKKIKFLSSKSFRGDWKKSFASQPVFMLLAKGSHSSFTTKKTGANWKL